MRKTLLRGTAAVLLTGLAGTAAAHTGHGTASLFEGFVHPLALDHLLAMVAVGVWSAAALTGVRRWFGPLAFLGAMTAGALFAIGAVALPFVEQGVAASVLVFGLMLAFATRVPALPGLALVALAAALHGVAHGAEMPPAASLAGYGAGFLLTTALLHLGGLGLGLRLLTLGPRVWPGLGALLGAAGLLMLARV